MQLETTIVIGIYNAQQEKATLWRVSKDNSIFLAAQSKQEAPKQICITWPLLLRRKKYVAKAWNCVELLLLLGNNPSLWDQHRLGGQYMTRRKCALPFDLPSNENGQHAVNFYICNYQCWVGIQFGGSKLLVLVPIIHNLELSWVLNLVLQLEKKLWRTRPGLESIAWEKITEKQNYKWGLTGG